MTPPALQTAAPEPTSAPQPTGSLFRLATAGSVDDGKSTLVGRLLHDAQAILSDQLSAVARSSAERGFGAEFASGPGGAGADSGPVLSQDGQLDDAARAARAEQPLDLALLTDGLRAEREQGITIDVAYRYFATDRRSFVLADCPGHVQYTRNTVTGTSTADAVVLLVDIRNGVVEQTRRHLAVASLLRVEHVVVAVNKMDAVDYAEAAFREVAADITAVAKELNAPVPLIIPVSALYGDNVVTTSSRMPWYRAPEYDGAALLPVLETLPDADAGQRSTEPLRFPVQTVIRPQGGLAPDVAADQFQDLRDYRGYAGQISSGELRAGTRVRVQPGPHITEITAVRRTALQQDLANQDLAHHQAAQAGESVVVELRDAFDVARGTILTDPDRPATEVQELTLRVAWLGDQPLHPGARVLFSHGTATVKALVTEVYDQLDISSLAALPAESLSLNDIGTVRVKLASTLPVDDYAESKRTGAALLIDPADGNTLAAGMIQLPRRDQHEVNGTDEEWLT